MLSRQDLRAPTTRDTGAPRAQAELQVRDAPISALRRALRAERLIPCAAVFLLLCGALAAALWWTDAVAFKAQIDASSPDGEAISFPLARTALIQARLGAYALGLCAAGLCALAFRKRLARLLRHTVTDGAELLGAWRAGFAAWARNERGHVLALGLIVVVAVAVRLAFLHQDMRYDEADSYLVYASRSLLFGLSDYNEPGNHLLNTLLTHLSVGLLGDAPWAVRLPALVAGILIVPATYWALRGWLGRSPALIAAGLTAGSSYLVHYSVNARGYGAVVLAFCLGLALCSHIAARPNRCGALLLGVVSALGFFAIPTMLLPSGTCFVWLAALAYRRRGDGRSRDRIADIVLAGATTIALTLVLYAPVFVVSGPGAVTNNKYVTAPTWAHMTELLGERLMIFAAEMGRTTGIAVLLVAGFLVWLARDLRRGAEAALLPAALLAWCAIVVVVNRTSPYGRVWTFAMPLCYGLGAAGLVAAVQRIPRMRTAALGALAGALTVWISADTLRTRSPSLSPEGERFAAAQEVATFLERSLAAEDRVLCVSLVRPALQYYLKRAGLPPEIMSHDAGGPAFTHAVLCVPLEEFNENLREWNIAPLTSDRLRPERRFEGAVVYRIEPPLPSRPTAPLPSVGGADAAVVTTPGEAVEERGHPEQGSVPH